MCGGVTKGFAGEKFSGSPSRLGSKRASERRRVMINIAPNKSL